MISQHENVLTLLCSFQGYPEGESLKTLTDFVVVLARGKHPFPFRTRQLSLSAPMILQGQPCGKVGRRHISFEKASL